MKKQHNFKFSEHVMNMLRKLAEKNGMSNTAMLEMLIIEARSSNEMSNEIIIADEYWLKTTQRRKSEVITPAMGEIVSSRKANNNISCEYYVMTDENGLEWRKNPDDTIHPYFDLNPYYEWEIVIRVGNDTLYPTEFVMIDGVEYGKDTRLWRQPTQEKQ